MTVSITMFVVCTSSSLMTSAEHVYMCVLRSGKREGEEKTYINKVFHISP